MEVFLTSYCHPLSGQLGGSFRVSNGRGKGSLFKNDWERVTWPEQSRHSNRRRESNPAAAVPPPHPPTSSLVTSGSSGGGGKHSGAQMCVCRASLSRAAMAARPVRQANGGGGGGEVWRGGRRGSLGGPGRRDCLILHISVQGDFLQNASHRLQARSHLIRLLRSLTRLR